MSMAWEENHRRYDLVDAALAEVARTGRPAVRVLLDAHPALTAVDTHHRDALLAATGVDQFDLRVRTRRVS
jgi:hypothetical protein